MPKIWNVVTKKSSYKNIVANTLYEADKILFYRVLHGKVPPHAKLSEESIIEVDESDIISIEDISQKAWENVYIW